MRNTPYPRYTIGHHGHAIFDLNKAPGLIQGITSLFDAKTVKVSDIAGFDLLAPGQTKTFEGAERVEVVDFGGHQGRGGFVSELKTQVLDLEGGSRLTGPVAWRVVDKSAPIEEEAATISNLGASIMIGFVIALLAGAALFSLFAAIAGVAMIAFFFAVCAVFSAFESSRKKTIERMGSVYVLAPGSRTWAGGSQPQA